jgi:hypothetical protein
MSKEPVSTGTQADAQEQKDARSRTREDHLAAGRRLAADENLARGKPTGVQPDVSSGAEANQGLPGRAVDNNDVSELSENDSSGG